VGLEEEEKEEEEDRCLRQTRAGAIHDFPTKTVSQVSDQQKAHMSKDASVRADLALCMQ
jgi:hypothetical protein